MKKEKIKNFIALGVILLLVLAIVGVSYAYFRLQIEGSGNDIVMDTGDLRLKYTDGKEISLSNAVPGDSVSKTVTVENIGTRDVTYQLNWSDLINTIENYELHVTLECKSYTGYGTTSQTESGECDRIYRAVPISDTSTSALIKNNISIAQGVTHEYNITVTFDDKDYDQSSNMKKSFTGKIDISEYNAPKPIYCTYDGEVTNGTTFEKGLFTYSYAYYYSGWKVTLTDKTSVNPVTESPCTYINGKPIVRMTGMFYNSKASSIDVSGYNTTNVTSMYEMFSNTAATEIKGLENFDTSKVTDMRSMFSSSKATSIDVSNFDTSNVTDMGYMFGYSAATEIKGLENFDTSNVTRMELMFYDFNASYIDIDNFDTSKVTNMSNMFGKTKIKNLNVSNFDTSNVTDMNGMFYSSKFDAIDVSAFDTSNVTDMGGMFKESKAAEIKGLDKFNTSKVTTMSSMFSGVNIDSLDLSNFDTSKVTKMSNMFNNCTATTIKGIEKFDTSKVTNMSSMFSGVNIDSLDLSNFDTSKVTDMSSMFSGVNINSLDLSNFDTSNVTSMNNMFSSSKSIVIDVSSFDTSNVTNMSGMFANCYSLTTIYVCDEFVVDNVTSGSNMFINSTLLVGGNGTKYNLFNTDKEYARIDTADTPGYFTLKNN